MGLRDYNKKRNFTKTREPRGVKAKSGKALHFVIQKHDASHLHYDFRLELDGVLKSWAVPKGPSLDPAQKRLAMQVEDHPMDYAGFEGTIPKGEYGGGTVMVWDQGTWTPEKGDPEASLAKGGLKFSLAGEKLKGTWKLFRIKKPENGKAPWLLVKEADKYALKANQKDIVVTKPKSVISGRDIAQIAGDVKGLEWKSNRGAVKKTTKAVKKTAKTLTTKRGAKAVTSSNVASSIIDVPDAPKREISQAETTIHGVRLSHPAKILYPDDRIKKIEIAEYYEAVAKKMLPHIEGRPLMVVRYPNGASEKGVFQKNWNNTLPSSLKKIRAKHDGETDTFFTVDSTEGLLGLAQLGVLEIHCWNTHAEHIEHPDQWIIDLDPAPNVKWSEVVDGAQLVKKRFELYKMKCFLKTTGGKGLHVVVPVLPKLDWEMGKAFAEAICKDIEADFPKKFLVTMSKAKREGKIFLDYLRNGRGATAVAPYSTRAREHAPVSMPISWAELDKGVRSDEFTVRNYSERLKLAKNDVWKDILKVKQFPKT